MNYHIEILEIFHKIKKLHFIKLLPTGLTHGEYFTILKLKSLEESDKDKKITFSTLADMLHVSSPALSRTIKHLEEKGYVVRISDDVDRRNNFLKVSKAGKDTIKEIEGYMDSYCKKIYKRLGDDRIKDFIKCLNDLYDISLEEIKKIES